MAELNGGTWLEAINTGLQQATEDMSNYYENQKYGVYSHSAPEVALPQYGISVPDVNLPPYWVVSKEDQKYPTENYTYNTSNSFTVQGVSSKQRTYKPNCPNPSSSKGTCVVEK